jgi:hypothetical protein
MVRASGPGLMGWVGFTGPSREEKEMVSEFLYPFFCSTLFLEKFKTYQVSAYHLNSDRNFFE